MMAHKVELELQLASEIDLHPEIPVNTSCQHIEELFFGQLWLCKAVRRTPLKKFKFYCSSGSFGFAKLFDEPH